MKRFVRFNSTTPPTPTPPAAATSKPSSTAATAKKKSKFGFGKFATSVLLVGGTAASAYLYVNDRKQFDEIVSVIGTGIEEAQIPAKLNDFYEFVQSKFNELTSGSVSSSSSPPTATPVRVITPPVKKPVTETTTVSPAPTPADQPPSVTATPVTLAKPTTIVYKEDPKAKETIAQLQSQVQKLSLELEQAKLAQTSSSAQQQMKYLKMVDAVSMDFQKALDLARNDVNKTEESYKKQITDIQRTFDASVDAKVNEKASLRLSELYGLGSMVDKLRQNTLQFGNYAVMNGFVLDMVKLVNTLGYTATLNSDNDENLRRIKQSLAVKDEFVATVLDNMPSKVESNDTLRTAYLQLKPRLYQISLMPKDGGLLSYMVSRILSPFMFAVDASKSSGDINGNEIELIDTHIKNGNLVEALDSAVKLSEQGWNSVVIDGFVEQLRKRVEFDVGLMALEAHLGLISTHALIPCGLKKH